jgi:nucleotide-binding universal stress UspA family protein
VSFPQERAPRILVTLDGSELAEAVLTPVADFAKQLHSEVILLQVVDPTPQPLYPDAAPVQFVEDPDAELESARTYLNRVADRLRPIKSVRARVELGRVVPRIASVASEEQADVVALATRGRGGLARLVLGSTASSLLGHLNVPLFLVRPMAPVPIGVPAAAYASIG